MLRGCDLLPSDLPVWGDFFSLQGCEGMSLRHRLSRVRTGALAGNDPANLLQLALGFSGLGVVAPGLGDIQLREDDRGSILGQRRKGIALRHLLVSTRPTTIVSLRKIASEGDIPDIRAAQTLCFTGFENIGGGYLEIVLFLVSLSSGVDPRLQVAVNLRPFVLLDSGHRPG